MAVFFLLVFYLFGCLALAFVTLFFVYKFNVTKAIFLVSVFDLKLTFGLILFWSDLFGPQSLDSETSPIKSKDPPPAFLPTQTLPDGNFQPDSESDADQRQTLRSDDLMEQQQALRFQSGRQASLPDVPNSSGPLGLHRPVSDPGLPGP